MSEPMLQPDSRQAKLESLHIAPFHKRVRWGDLNALAESIRAARCVLVPLLVRERPRSQGGYEIIHGARRRRAAEIAEIKLVPIRIVDVDDATAIQMQLDENIQREDMHPLDEAGYYKELADRGMEQAAIAKRFGKTKKDVVRRLALLGLCDRARAAFAKDQFDEDAAMAIASLDVAARQHDILAALAAGSLQVEDVPGFVQREMQAPLEGVPWRLSDAELDRKAGACTNCPKRTSVQRELFDDGGKGGDRCRDVKCYRGKMEAVFRIEAAKPGVSVLEDPAAALFVPTAGGRPSVMKSSGMIDAEANCQHVSGLTWLEAVQGAQDEDNPPTLYLARDQDGRPRWLFREAIVVKLVRKSEAAAAQVAQRDAADPAKPEGADNIRAENKIRRAVIDQLAERVVAANADIHPWITSQVIEAATRRSVMKAADIFEDAIKQDCPAGLVGAEALRALAARSTRMAKLVAGVVQIYELAADVEMPEALRALAMLCDLDLEEIERAIRGGPGAPSGDEA